MMILGLILAVFAILLTLSIEKSYKDQTGVNAPSRRTMSYLRRRAREKGITVAEAHDQWLTRKQKAAGIPPDQPPTNSKIVDSGRGYTIVYAGRNGDEASLIFHCRACGGNIMHVDDDETAPQSLVTCKACCQPFGTVQQLQDSGQEYMAKLGVKTTTSTMYRTDGTPVVWR
ncbi:MAG: hypothetical protein J7515_17675 [Caulobacter sp.]|nr:hypothetical protein [Caulobacter sp.]